MRLRIRLRPESDTPWGHLIVSAECLASGFLAGFRKSDGKELWRTDRKVKTSYSSPIVARVGGRDQILLSGAAKVSGYDPADGKLLWQIDGSCSATCGTMVWNEDTVFASGGFPNKETLAVRPAGTPSVLWKNTDMSYEQSLLYYDGHLYTLNDGGIAVCWDAGTGEEKWKVRLGGPVSASPVLAGGRIYAMNERGIMHVFSPTRGPSPSWPKTPSATRGLPRPPLSERKSSSAPPRMPVNARNGFIASPRSDRKK